MGHRISPRSNSAGFPGWTLFLGLLGLGAVIAFLMFWRASVTVQGEEFSPYSFNVREFEYIPQYRTRNEPAALVCSSEITKHLTNATTSSKGVVWDVVRYQKGVFPAESLGEASLLVDAIRHATPRGEDWESWSKEKPKLAAILWPAVQQIAIHGAYFAIPDLLEIAAAESTETNLKAQLDRASQQAAMDQASRLLKRGAIEKASEVALWAKSFGDVEALHRLEYELKRAASDSVLK